MDTQPSLPLPQTQGETLILRKWDWKLPVRLIPQLRGVSITLCPSNAAAPQKLLWHFLGCTADKALAMISFLGSWAQVLSCLSHILSFLILSSVLSVCLFTASSWLDLDCKTFDREVTLLLYLFLQQEQNPLCLWPRSWALHLFN